MQMTFDVVYEVTRANGKKQIITTDQFPNAGLDFKIRLEQLKTLMPDAIDWNLEIGVLKT